MHPVRGADYAGGTVSIRKASAFEVVQQTAQFLAGDSSKSRWHRELVRRIDLGIMPHTRSVVVLLSRAEDWHHHHREGVTVGQWLPEPVLKLSKFAEEYLRNV